MTWCNRLLVFFACFIQAIFAKPGIHSGDYYVKSSKPGPNIIPVETVIKIIELKTQIESETGENVVEILFGSANGKQILFMFEGGKTIICLFLSGPREEEGSGFEPETEQPDVTLSDGVVMQLKDTSPSVQTSLEPFGFDKLVDLEIEF